MVIMVFIPLVNKYLYCGDQSKKWARRQESFMKYTKWTYTHNYLKAMIVLLLQWVIKEKFLVC